MNPTKIVEQLHNIARAIFVIDHAPKGEKLDGYAVLTIRNAVTSIKSLRGQLDTIEAAFEALIK